MSDFGYGQMTPWDSSDDVNVIAFIVRQMMARMSTMKLVQVVAVAGGGPSAGPGTVSVQPLVSQVDGNNNATPHGVVNGIPWARPQGGLSAIIVDPKAGDIGYVVAADRDISNVKAIRKMATPGSLRHFSLSDGIYVGGVLGAAPTQYLLFGDDGLVILDLHGNMLKSTADGFEITGKVVVSGDVIAGGISLQNHVHGGVTIGAAETSPPILP